MVNKILEFRNLFHQNKIDGYMISTKDEYLSEYPPSCAKRLEYLTGFTGSNGLSLILKDTILFFTDGRYLTQCKMQLDEKLYQVFDQKFLPNFPWANYIKTDYVIGYDPRIFTDNILLNFKTLKLKPIENNLVDQIWHDQPKKPNSKIYNYDIKFAGESAENKIDKYRKFLTDNDAEFFLITNPEAVCWLFNIRASDIEFSPLLLASACISMDFSYLFTDIERISQEILDEKPFIKILPNSSLEEIISKAKGRVLFDENLCSKYISDLIKQKQHKSLQDPSMLWKSCKNDVEITCMRDAHIQDAVAVCEFLAFIANNDMSNYTEYDLGIILSDLRSKRENYVMDSFPSIIGFGENGAVIHYRAEKETSKKIENNGLLLIDSGGQYLGATTDITRVVAIGAPKNKYREYYSKVLKGHLNLAMIKFPENSVTGANLDLSARQFLWYNGDDYPHGTGHGVGSFLSVHEGPQNISLNSYQTKFASGMVVSNEPGFYLPGEFGIRIENMMYVKNSIYPNFLEFEMLTLVPYEKNLIDMNMLNQKELEFLDNYYKKIEEKILPHLSTNAKSWLKWQINLVDGKAVY